MKKSFLFLSIVGLLGLAWMNTACTPEGICKNGNGTILTDTLSLPAFTAINLSESATVFVQQGASQEIVVEADENVLQALDIKVENDDLKIDIDGCFFSYDMNVYITVPASQAQRNFTVSGSGEIFVQDSLVLAQNFRAIVSGSGEIELIAANTVNQVDLTVSGSGAIDMDYDASATVSKISGSGDLDLSGASKDHEITISGSGDLFGFDLLTTNTDITVSGAGDAEINVDGGILDARISGSGDILYKGTPSAVNSSVSGSGSLTKVQ